MQSSFIQSQFGQPRFGAVTLTELSEPCQSTPGKAGFALTGQDAQDYADLSYREKGGTQYVTVVTDDFYEDGQWKITVKKPGDCIPTGVEFNNPETSLPKLARFIQEKAPLDTPQKNKLLERLQRFAKTQNIELQYQARPSDDDTTTKITRLSEPCQNTAGKASFVLKGKTANEYADLAYRTKDDGTRYVEIITDDFRDEQGQPIITIKKPGSGLSSNIEYEQESFPLLTQFIQEEAPLDAPQKNKLLERLERFARVKDIELAKQQAAQAHEAAAPSTDMVAAPAPEASLDIVAEPPADTVVFNQPESAEIPTFIPFSPSTENPFAEGQVAQASNTSEPAVNPFITDDAPAEPLSLRDNKEELAIPTEERSDIGRLTKAFTQKFRKLRDSLPTEQAPDIAEASAAE